MGGGFWRLIDHYIVLCLFLALFILTLLGVGDVRTVSLLGLLLCAVGLVQAPAVAAAGAKIDCWILGSLLAYNLLSAFSSWVTFGNIADGYAGCQLIWPLLYLLLAGLSADEQLWLRRLCAGFAGLVALAGIAQFCYAVLTTGNARRLAGLLGNPNALGIFLVVGWLIWQGCRPKLASSKQPNLALNLWFALEAFMLMALALTLSLGSFLAMAVGILILVLGRKAERGCSAAVVYLAQLLAKATFGVGTGLLLYLAAARTDYPWLCLPLLLYALAVAAGWRDFERFLLAKPKAAVGLAAFGGLVAAGLVLVRPSSLATFAERLQMMSNGLSYCWQNPLWGVGPYQWRGLNMQDADKFFNTWHIHNAFIHVWVELGLLAAVALFILAVRICLKHLRQPAARAEFGAFLTHSMLDTSFFYLGITALVLLTVAQPSQTFGLRLSCWVWRLLFGLLALLFAWNCYCFVG